MPAKNKHNPLRQQLTRPFLNGVQGFIKYTPSIITRPLFEILFFFVYLFIRKLRVICRITIKQAYGNTKSESEIATITRRCIKNVGLAFYDMVHYGQRAELLKKTSALSGEQYLKDVLKEGKGAICSTAHMGNFPIMFMILIQHGYKPNVIIRPMRDKHFSQFMFDFCAIWGVNMIQTLPQKNFLKESMAALKRNELLFILCDEYTQDETSMKVPFFGSQVNRTVGPTLFHKRLGSPIIPIFTYFKNDKFRVEIQPRIALSTDDGQILTQISQATEKQVQKYPEQWGGWLNKRWAEQHGF